MSVIHSSCDPVGARSADSDGTASRSTVRTIVASKHGSASAARPIHSPAGPLDV